jgi:hypothetical protein
MLRPCRCSGEDIRLAFTGHSTYPEEEQDSNQHNRINRLPQRELSSISPLVIAILKRILLQPFRSHIRNSTKKSPTAIQRLGKSDLKIQTKYAGPRLPTYAHLSTRVVLAPAMQIRSFDMIQADSLACRKRATDDHCDDWDIPQSLCEVAPNPWFPRTLHASHGVRLRASTACVGVKMGRRIGVELGV